MSEERYYDNLEEAESPARQSGWRRAIGQLARFEMAIAPWRKTGVESVLDLGCGTGELARYLAATGWDVAYTGVDRRARVLEVARGRHPEARFVERDFAESSLEETFDLAVAVGAQVDGDPPDSHDDRRGRVGRVIERVVRSSRVGWSCVVLDAAALERRVAIAAEPAVFGVTAEELERVVSDEASGAVVGASGVRTDLVAFGPRERTGGPAWSEASLRRVVEAHRAAGGSALDEVWLYLEVGAYERAERRLRAIEGDGLRRSHLADRLREERT